MAEWRKLTINIDNMSAEMLRHRVRRLAEMLRYRDEPNNYQVECHHLDGTLDVMVRGTRDWCIGYATAMASCASVGTVYRAVAPSGYVVWPEEDEGWPGD